MAWSTGNDPPTRTFAAKSSESLERDQSHALLFEKITFLK
jgi:hypothetical protein